MEHSEVGWIWSKWERRYPAKGCTTQKDVQPRNSQFIAIWPVNGVEEINRMGNKGDVGQTSRSHVVDEGDQLK